MEFAPNAIRRMLRTSLPPKKRRLTLTLAPETARKSRAALAMPLY